jgi:hypothetical protein
MDDYYLSSIKSNIKWTYSLFEAQFVFNVLLLIIFGLPFLNPFFVGAQLLGFCIVLLTKRIQKHTIIQSRISLWGVILVGFFVIISSTYLTFGTIPIHSTHQLERMRWNPKGHFQLSSDIDFEANRFENKTCVIKSFSGTLDGNHHTIHDLSVPLFCKVSQGVVKDLYLRDVAIQFTDVDFNGSVANVNIGSLKNVHVSGSIQSTALTGGLVGINAGSISGCSFHGDIIAPYGHRVGGIVSSNRGMIESTFAIGSIEAFSSIGGIAGASDLGTIRNAYSRMDMTGQTYIGGIVGRSVDTELSGLIVHGDITGISSVAVITPTYHTYDYDVLFTGRIYSDTYVVEPHVLYHQSQLFTVPPSNQIHISEIDDDFWIQTLGLDLSIYRIDDLYPKLIHNEE